MSIDYVIQHAAPTLAGIKTGNLFPCTFASTQDMVRDLRELLYLFRPADLSRDLAGQEARRLLREAGYGDDLTHLVCLRELTRRLREGEEFPHEIGLFLGYPPEDVAGFMTHRGKNCKCVGCWKVYGDEYAARRRFAAYQSCTANYCRRRAGGASLEGLTVSRLPQ